MIVDVYSSRREDAGSNPARSTYRKESEMGYYAKDVYYDSDHFGLEKVLELDEQDMSYEFNTFVVWKDKDGVYYWASDSGCSCPSPFESYNDLASLEHGPIERARDAAVEWVKGVETVYYEWQSPRKATMSVDEVRRTLT